ncbi:hypothetical protein SLS56_008684 [Neofusicoccum ribis]|uniref:NmrA-like domain-containing protein n=1 Tax=Neofusicoccum ribis TaxID=45134 RepID=A0ABR3SJC0_9PEZI
MNDSAAEHGATPLEVDYSNVSVLAEVLAARNIGTVISALNMDSQNASDAQISLIQAASASGSVTRFIPSDFNVDYDVSDELFPYPEKSFHQQAKAELQKHPGLTCTSIQAGMSMDYYGMPRLKTHLWALVAFVDVEHRKAAIPGDGNAKVVFTLTGDLAKFVVALLDLPTEKWPRSAMVVGDRLTLNKLVEMAEKIVGR